MPFTYLHLQFTLKLIATSKKEPSSSYHHTTINFTLLFGSSLCGETWTVCHTVQAVVRVQSKDNQVRRTFCLRETWQVTLQTQLIVSTLIYFYQIWTLTSWHHLALPRPCLEPGLHLALITGLSCPEVSRRRS